MFWMVYSLLATCLVIPAWRVFPESNLLVTRAWVTFFLVLLGNHLKMFLSVFWVWKKDAETVLSYAVMSSL